MPILKCIFPFARAFARGKVIWSWTAVDPAFLRFDFIARWTLWCIWCLENARLDASKNEQDEAKCTTECRTFRRKNANEQIAPRNWDGSPKPRNTRRQRPAITAFLFRVTLVRYVKIKQEIWLYSAFNCGARRFGGSIRALYRDAVFDKLGRRY